MNNNNDRSESYMQIVKVKSEVKNRVVEQLGSATLLFVVSLCILVLLFVITDKFNPKPEVVVTEKLATDQLQVSEPKHDVRFLSEQQTVNNNLSPSVDHSDLSPTLDAITDIFSLFNVKIPTHIPSDPDIKNIIDTLLVNYMVSLESESDYMREQLLKEIPNGSPVSFKGETSPFGMRVHPIHGLKQKHNGLDLRAKIGTPVISAADGIVEFTGVTDSSRALGLSVVVDHNHGFKTIYGHLQKFVVKQGDFIKKGDVIALSGNSGVTNGPHLHYEVRFLNKVLDPANFVKWSGDNFDSLFQLENGVQWSSLLDRVNKKVQRDEAKSERLVNTN
ncbi:MAG: M23 family metallopeptidase [Magnetococcales bacterium]|nr:M23 family metallopeptidase [Magnetococcales bacterium]